MKNFDAKPSMKSEEQYQLKWQPFLILGAATFALVPILVIWLDVAKLRAQSKCHPTYHYKWTSLLHFAMYLLPKKLKFLHFWSFE